MTILSFIFLLSIISSVSNDGGNSLMVILTFSMFQIIDEVTKLL